MPSGRPLARDNDTGKAIDACERMRRYRATHARPEELLLRYVTRELEQRLNNRSALVTALQTASVAQRMGLESP